jgi:apolipoprotein N-acyltransferase
MMRSKRRTRVPLRQRVRDNPFLIIALLSGLGLALLLLLEPSAGSALDLVLGFLWETLGLGFHWMGNLVGRLLPDLDLLLARLLTALLGLMLYLIADMLWRHLLFVMRS